MSVSMLTQPIRFACKTLLVTALLGATSHAAAPQQSDWAALGKLPNFTEGVWGYNFTPAATAQAGAGGGAPVRKPGVPADTRVATGETCMPIGVPSIMSKPYPFEFVFAPGRVTMLMEFDGLVRRIYTDGRKHPEDPDLTYAGYSIGHWEKDTLVVDTTGLLPEVQVAAGVAADSTTHVIERMRLTAPDTLTIEYTIDAPNKLAKPWSYTRVYQRHRDWEVQEYFCQQNPRLTTDADGNNIPDLTPPAK
ncbi:MAG: hypothetical protein QM808_03670 [Steroidobacteraceae bacterium]